MEHELTQPGILLDANGRLAQVGWSRQPLLDCNLEAARFYAIRPLQRFRVKRWDYYAVFTPQRFFSATIANLGYAGNIFLYILDYASNSLHEEGLVIPFGKGIILPRNSTAGDARFSNGNVSLDFLDVPGGRRLLVRWPGFNAGKGVEADLFLHLMPEHDSMTLTIPIGERRFYYNRKINCLPAEGTIRYGDALEELKPDESLGSLDWGRGVWNYSSYWNWASASGFMGDKRSIGLNLGSGFGDTSRATENAFILEGRLHKLGAVRFDYTSGDYMKPWHFTDSQGRCDLEFIPFKERVATTNLGVIFSEVHQMFGHYSGFVISELNEKVLIDQLTGFAEEHHARW